MIGVLLEMQRFPCANEANESLETSSYHDYSSETIPIHSTHAAKAS